MGSDIKGPNNKASSTLMTDLKLLCAKLKNSPSWAKTAIAAIFLSWLLLPLIIVLCYRRFPNDAGAFGDIFGSVNALFAGLAFFGIIVTIILQKQELAQNTAELRNSARALHEQVELMQLSARLSALPEFIEQEKQRLSGLDFKKFKNISELSFTPETLRLAISGYAESLAKSTNRRKTLEDNAGFLISKHQNAEDGESELAARQKKIELLEKRDTAIKNSLERLLMFTEELDSVYGELSNRPKLQMDEPG